VVPPAAEKLKGRTRSANIAHKIGWTSQKTTAFICSPDLRHCRPKETKDDPSTPFCRTKKDVTRRIFIALFQLAGHDTRRNMLWRQFVPLVKDSSEKLNQIQRYMVAHQHEATLATLDRTFLVDIDACVADLEEMIKKLRALQNICKQGG
jgi:hypothetical protein